MIEFLQLCGGLVAIGAGAIAAEPQLSEKIGDNLLMAPGRVVVGEKMADVAPQSQLPPAAPEVLPAIWRDFLERIGDRHTVVQRGTNWLSLGWPEDKPRQTVAIKCCMIHGRMRLLVTAAVCRFDLTTQHEVLTLGTRLLLGAMILENGIVSIRYIFTDGFFSKPDLDEVVLSLRDNALRARRLISEGAEARTQQILNSLF